MNINARQRRYQRLVRLADGPNTAVTILYARKFLAHYPNHGLAWLWLGITLGGVARYDEAELAFAAALDFCPANKRQHVLHHLGNLSRAKGEYDLAALWFRKAIATAPREAGNHIFLGAVLAKQGRLGEAEAAHRAALLCTEGCIDEAHLNLGLVLRAQERFEEAAECFRAAIRIDPEYVEARRALRDVERAIIVQQRDR